MDMLEVGDMVSYRSNQYDLRSNETGIILEISSPKNREHQICTVYWFRTGLKSGHGPLQLKLISPKGEDYVDIKRRRESSD